MKSKLKSMWYVPNRTKEQIAYCNDRLVKVSKKDKPKSK
jgi:hypothetical protein